MELTGKHVHMHRQVSATDIGRPHLVCRAERDTIISGHAWLAPRACAHTRHPCTGWPSCTQARYICSGGTQERCCPAS